MAEFAPKKTPESKRLLFKEGQQVAVVRHSGALESDWEVMAYDTIKNKYLVGKKGADEDKTMVKLQTEEQLLAAQRLYQEQSAAAIAAAGIFMSEDSKLVRQSEIAERFRQAEEEFANIKLEDISDEESAALMRQVEIHGDEFAGELLTAEKLSAADLGPRFRVRIGELLFWFSSRPYEITGDRLAVMAYVQQDDRLVARSFYLSNSHGVWKYLPEYLYNETDKKINWYGKGYDEISITLPAALQIALARLSADSRPSEPENAEAVFAGTAKKIGSHSRYDANPPTYYAQVEAKPREIGSKIEAELPVERTIMFRKKARPESMRVKNAMDEPEFSRLIAAARQQSAIYGTITLEVFLSRNGQYRYLFCRDEENRAWIGGIENDSPYQPVGLRKNWIKAGDLCTSAYEYKSQEGGYGNYDKTKGNYVDMFDKYLSRVDIIKRYLASVRERAEA